MGRIILVRHYMVQNSITADILRYSVESREILALRIFYDKVVNDDASLKFDYHIRMSRVLCDKFTIL